jgi:hypothetical protein
LSAEQFPVIAGLLRRSPAGLESSIHGTSMEPAIPDGSRIRIRPGSCEPGQVAACILGERLFAHRIVHRGRDRQGAFVLTRGDGWLLCDPPTREERILGVVSEYWDGRAWQAPGAPVPLRSWRRAVSLASFGLVRASLVIHHECARRVAGSLLALGALCKRLRRADGRDRATRR